MADNAAVDPTLDLIERAITQMGDVIAAITPEQASLPTPCEDWHVRRLVNHVVGQILRDFVISARGETPQWGAPHEDIGDDWGAEFRTRARPLLETWRAADLDRLVPGMGGEAPLRGRADQQITEFAMHAWDLSRATGQTRTLDPELAEHALAWSKQLLKPEFRGPGKAFGHEVPIADDAPAYDRLAAWFGRDPGWTAPA
ncbi:TIGR03086 family metal-binding protein [Nocardia sp. CDC160]|uniref:TIGR03086 family metal-binding protein n=1 Tax=Nocardia sp. CDC160 TaxID=3112166 RepID=UPI002DBE092E|nr:TIGR03086 family metal-binding protein [Nocardia sp. CDC160]MEC3913005.1 TIGR03086 family metal-binding protein [Nocardia sp. CDC160]